VARDDQRVAAPNDFILRAGDIIALGGRTEAMTEKMGLIGPEVADRTALDIPLDQAEIVVTNKEYVGRTAAELRAMPHANFIGVRQLERGGVPVPIGPGTKLQRMDISVVGSRRRRRRRQMLDASCGPAPRPAC
jgi:putative transport protein